MNKPTLLQQLKHERPFIAGALALVWQGLFFILPISCIIAISFLDIHSFEAFATFIYAKIIIRSLVIAFLVACICLSIAYPLAYWIARQSRIKKTIAFFFVILPFWTNFLLHIFAWFFVLERGGFINQLLMGLGIIREPLQLLNTWFAVFLMMVYYYLPFYLLPLYSALERFDWKMIEASLDLGATWSQTIQRIMIPQTQQAIQSGFFLVFIPAFGEFIIPELMGGDRYVMVGSVVSQLVLNPKTLAQGAAFVVISSIALLITSYSIIRMQQSIISRLGKGT
jgi:spermidine/putrescine transport system permease protein